MRITNGEEVVTIMERGCIYLQTDREQCDTGEIAHEKQIEIMRVLMLFRLPGSSERGQGAAAPTARGLLLPHLAYYRR